MSAGKRYKFQGSTIKFMTAYQGGSPVIDISGITKANPAVVTTSGAHGFSSGDPVYLVNVTGMTEVNNDLFVAVVLSSTTFSLWGVDSSGYGTFLTGQADPVTMSTWCELTDYNRQGGSSPEIDATTICSTAKEYEIGLPDFGTTAVSFNFAPTTSVQTALRAFYLSGAKIAIHATLPNSGGDTVQLGFVQQTSEQSAVSGLWKGQATIRNTGNPYQY